MMRSSIILFCLLCTTCFARTIRVPTDRPTIQAGIDAAVNGDTVVVAPGTYRGVGNRNIDFHGKQLLLKGLQSAQPALIFLNYDEGILARAFIFQSGEDVRSVVDGFEIRGYTSLEPNPYPSVCELTGGGLLCSESSPTIRNCTFANLYSEHAGGAVHLRRSAAKFLNCKFVENSSPGNTLQYESSIGGAVHCDTGSSALFESCLFDKNRAYYGGSIAVDSASVELLGCTLVRGGLACRNSDIVMERTSISFAKTVFDCYETNSVQMTCCNLYSGSANEWTACIKSQEGENGNISANPRFVKFDDPSAGLYSSSPSAPSMSSCRQLIGCIPVTQVSLFRAISVRADRTGDYPTCQAAIDAAGSGDTILLGPGTYLGPGNYNLDFRGKALVFRSVEGPERTTIRPDSASLGRGFQLWCYEDSTTVIEGISVERSRNRAGGGIYAYPSSPTVRNCRFVRNVIDRLDEIGGGLGVYCMNSAITLEHCLFLGNTNSGCCGYSSALMAGGSALTVTNCTFAFNSIHGAGTPTVWIANSTKRPVFDACLFAFNEANFPFTCDDTLDVPALSCSDIVSNSGGDWLGAVWDQSGTNGNMSADPLFCDTASRDLRLGTGSPCLKANNSCNVDVGALPGGCGSTNIDDQPHISIPVSLDLGQNYPNPFNPRTRICFSLPSRADVTFTIYNIAGQTIRSLKSGSFAVGEHFIEWDGCDDSGAPVASGVYFYRLVAGREARSMKMLLLK